MNSSSAISYNQVNSELYNDLLLKENKTTLPYIKVKYFNDSQKECEVELNLDIMNKIIGFLHSKDLLSLACTNRRAFLHTNNCNSNFWSTYNNDIVQLNLKPGKSVFTCMINTGENEMWELAHAFIPKIKDLNNTYLFECFFISAPKNAEAKEIAEPSDIEIQILEDAEQKIEDKSISKEKEPKTLMKPAFVIQVGVNPKLQVGKDPSNVITSQWIFRKEFVPTIRCSSAFNVNYDAIINRRNVKTIPIHVFAFNIKNLPKCDTSTAIETSKSEKYNNLVTSVQDRVKYISPENREKRRIEKIKKADDNAQANCGKIAGVVFVALLAFSAFEKAVSYGYIL